MSFYIKKNLYDKFKINSNKHIQRPMTNIKLKSSSITVNNNSQRYLLSKILKGTKSILKSKTKFTEYMNEYQSIISKPTFKRPNIQNYPLLRRKYSLMIPIKRKNLENQKSKNVIKNYINKKINYETFREKFKHNLSVSMSSLEERNQKYNIKLYNKKKEKEKEKEKLLLFSDFFYKWNRKKDYNPTNNLLNINNNNYNSNYSNLSYDENKIFYSDYSNLIKEKIFYLKKNKIENLQKSLKINIFDSQKKKIKLKLISMKLIFEPINNDTINNSKKEYNFEDYQEIYNFKNEESEDDKKDINANKNIITFPLSYVFLLYINGIDFFKDILLASIKFSNDYQKIFFKEDEIYEVLRKEKERRLKKIKGRNQRIPEQKGSVKLLPRANVIKRTISIKLKNKTLNNNFEENLKKGQENEKSINLILNNLTNEMDINDLYQTDKKIVTIHANPDLRSKEKIKNESNFNKKKEIKYSEYCFIWETPNKTYRVRIIMPIIIYWSEHIQKNIIIYCDKNLFLYLLQNNFVNWDFYVLNYLFSIKIFRQIILSGLSFYKNNNINNNNIEISSFTERERKNEIISSFLKNLNNSLFSFINEKTIFFNINKKVYNQLNENNESYKFFYTDNFSINSIIDFHSYHIFIESDKINSKICWEFALSFKQMKYLSNINKYENLESFLPKIIQTNFEDGKLSIDFSVFEFFNKKIFEHNLKEEKEEAKNVFSFKDLSINDESNRKKIYKDMTLVIKMPFIVVEQYVKSQFLSNNMKKIFLNSNFLIFLGSYQNIYWPKKILYFINNQLSNSGHNNSCLNLTKGEKIFSFKDDNKKDYHTHFDNYINDYHKYKQYSKSFHYKKKKVNV